MNYTHYYECESIETKLKRLKKGDRITIDYRTGGINFTIHDALVASVSEKSIWLRADDSSNHVDLRFEDITIKSFEKHAPKTKPVSELGFGDKITFQAGEGAPEYKVISPLMVLADKNKVVIVVEDVNNPGVIFSLVRDEDAQMTVTPSGAHYMNHSEN